MQSANLALAIIAFLCVILALKIAHIGFSVFVSYRWPHFCERVYSIYVERPMRCRIVGLVNALILPLLALLLMSTEILALPGLMVFAFAFALVAIGRPAAYRDMGERLIPNESELRRLLVGGFVSEGAFLMPIIGQLLAVAVLVRALGACIIAILTRGTPAA